MAKKSYIGTWEIIQCEYLCNIGCCERHIKYMEGVKFRLDDNGDVTWFINDELNSVPLFSCETFEIYLDANRSDYVLRFGAYAGHVFEFTPNATKKTDSVVLTCDGLCRLHCIRYNENPNIKTSGATCFTMLRALEDGFFSDLTITASNNKQFKVHFIVLELQVNDVDWKSDPPPFSNIPEDVLGTILQYVYAEYLPDNLSEETIRQIITIASPYKSLSKLVQNCQSYLNNMALKQQIILLVDDMHCCINQIIDRFQPKSNPSENLVSNPAKLCFAVKQSIRDAAVAAVKLLLLCDLFTKRKNELSKNERNEIIRYAKSRLPIFLSQITRFLQALKDTFSSMSPAERVEIATFLVTEIEVILSTISLLIVHVDTTLQQIIQGLFTAGAPKSKTNVGDILSKTVRNLLHIRELTKLNTFHDHVNCCLRLLLHKRESFNDMSSSQKIRSIARNLEQLIEELPIFVIRLEETASVFDDRLEWSDFKFCFKVATSKVSDMLQKLIVHGDSLQDVMLEVCELVQRDAFTQTLHCLGLLNTPASSSNTSETPKTTRNASFSAPNPFDYKLNLVHSLCVPPDAKDSRLATLSLQLLDSGEKADMQFEVIGSNPCCEQNEEGATHEEKCIIKAHRVIVASRCDWFRRALLSGMREAIDKKIVIHDTSPFLFRTCLSYLYSGQLKPDSLSTEQLAELLLLSDRYEMDGLKVTCENALGCCLDDDTIFYLTSLADQYNCAVLNTYCLNYIAQNQQLSESEEFLELPIDLRAKIVKHLWSERTLMRTNIHPYSFERLHPTSSASSNSFHCSSPGVNELRNTMESMLLTPELDRNHSNSSSLEDLRLEQNSTQMETCITQLRDIVGDTASRETLVQVILAADFDLRRAVNYYYTLSSNPDE